MRLVVRVCLQVLVDRDGKGLMEQRVGAAPENLHDPSLAGDEEKEEQEEGDRSSLVLLHTCAGLDKV